MKRFSKIFISIILCVTLFGCSSAAGENSVVNSESSAASVTEATITADEASDNTTASDTSVSNKISSSGQNSTDNKKDSSTSNTDSKKSTAAKSTTNAAETSNNKKGTAKRTTTKKQTTTSSTITCTVTVECKSILSNMDNLKAGHEAYVPSDGYIINGCTVTVDNGSSAYDAVKTACSKQGVYLNTSNSSYGIYVSGFNNIDEKDCGSQSGWLYSVNGTYPGKSCSKYILSNGDNVVFTYTCS